jgi:hypothetical protein
MVMHRQKYCRHVICDVHMHFLPIMWYKIDSVWTDVTVCALCEM